MVNGDWARFGGTIFLLPCGEEWQLDIQHIHAYTWLLFERADFLALLWRMELTSAYIYQIHYRWTMDA